MNAFERSEWLLGKPAMDKLARAHVAVFGLGGVGGACMEALARAGVGELSLFDMDIISLTNLNRQTLALRTTLDMKKTEAATARARQINEHIILHAHDVFYDAQTADDYPLSAYDFIIDCIDTVSSKLLLIERAQKAQAPILCSMGTGNKLDPTRFQISSIEKTSVCPLARVMRTEMKRRSLAPVPVLWSDEPPQKPQGAPRECGRHIPGSVSFVPPVAGYILAGEAVKRLIQMPL